MDAILGDEPQAWTYDPHLTHPEHPSQGQASARWWMYKLVSVGGGLAPARMQWQQGPSRGLDFHFGEEHETQKKEWDFPTISSCYFLQGEVQLLGSLGDGPSSSEKEGRWTISEVCYLMEEHGDDSQIRTPTDLVREGMHCLTFWSSMKHKLHRSSLFREEFGVSLSAGESSCCRSGEEGGSGRTSVLLEGPRRQIWMQTQLSGS